MKVKRHFPDTIAKVVHGMMSEWKVLPFIVKIDRKHRGAGKGPWVPVGGIDNTLSRLDVSAGDLHVDDKTC